MDIVLRAELFTKAAGLARRIKVRGVDGISRPEKLATGSFRIHSLT
jgi:hypothetical protein